MKILFIISTLSKGGAERVLSVLANHLSANHEISILKFDEEEPFYKISKDVKIYSTKSGVGERGKFGNLIKRFDKFIGVRKFLKKSEFDAVISFLDYVNILTLLANLGLKNKIIISEHTNHTFLKSPIWRVLKRILYPMASGLSVLSRYDLAHYQKFVKNVKVLQNPMFEFKQKELKKENIILAAGRLMSFKGFDTFLRALSLVDKEKLKGWRVVIAGDGEDREGLENLARELGVNVDFVGFVKDIETWYEKSKIVAVTSRAEGFCNVVMESIFFDCARISTDCIAGPAELIDDEKDGFLCEVDDEKMIAKRLEMLISDENLREKFIKNANLRRDEFRVETVGKKWIEFIKQSI